MYLGKTKIFIIIFLVLLSIYQTANLWFEDLSNHKFFYYVKRFSSIEEVKNEVENNLKSIIINIGNDKFIQNFNGIDDYVYKETFDNAITTAIKSGKFSEVSDFDFNIALNNKCILYNYSYSISGTEVPTIFKAKNKNLSKIEKFDTICILPNLNKSDQVQVIFFDTLDLKQYEFTLNSSYGSKIYNIINNSYLNSNTYYTSSVNSGFELFEKNQFILNWDTPYFRYHKINAVNPVLKDNVVDTKVLENYVNLFFENPSIKWHISNDDTNTYSDETTIVKYSENGILEYSDYKVSTSESNSVFTSYITAINFLSIDTNIKNEYYLKNYVESQDKITFYFDYKINNLPINLSVEEKEKLSMESMIEVTVSQGKVSKYKRVIYDFYSDEEFSIFDKEFLDSIDNIIYKNFNNINNSYKIKNIELAYNFENLEENDNKILVGWFVEIGNEVFFEN